MKTPREILLAHHRAAEPKLDAIRQSAVAAVCDRCAATDSTRERRSQTAATIIQTLWRELILPSRRIWAGLAAVWVGILIINISQRDHSPGRGMASGSSAAMILTFQQQERLLAELTGPGEPRVAEPSKVFLPRPRSEWQREMMAT